VLEVLGQWASCCHVLDVSTVRNKETVLSSFSVVFSVDGGETPLLGDDDLLATRELVLATTESFDNVSLAVVLGTDRDQDLTNVNTSNSAYTES
jgi:hypothetical protein